METVVRDAEQREHFEGNISLELRLLHRIAEPRALEGLAAEGIAARPCETMPVSDGKAQMIFKPFAKDDLVRVVVAVGEWVGAVRTLKFDFGDIAEKTTAHDESPLVAG